MGAADIDRSLIAQVVREVREEIVEGEWKTLTKMVKDSGQSRRKIADGIRRKRFRTRLDGGLRMIHVPSWNAYIASCPEDNPRPRRSTKPQPTA